MEVLFWTIICILIFSGGTTFGASIMSGMKNHQIEKLKVQPQIMIDHVSPKSSSKTLLEVAKGKAYDERANSKVSQKTIDHALSYLDADKPIDWKEVISSRLKLLNPPYSSLTDVVKYSVSNFDTFSPHEQEEILESCVDGWVDGVKKALSLIMSEQNVLDRVNSKHDDDDTVLALETLPPLQTWEQEFAEIESRIDNEPRGGQ